MNTAEYLKKQLNALAQRVDGIYAIYITDRDGVSVLKATPDKGMDIQLRPRFLASHAVVFDQVNKLSLGKGKSIICYYVTHQLVVFNHIPWMISIVADQDANTGLLLSLDSELQHLLNDLKALPDLSSAAAT